MSSPRRKLVQRVFLLLVVLASWLVVIYDLRTGRSRHAGRPVAVPLIFTAVLDLWRDRFRGWLGARESWQVAGLRLRSAQVYRIQARYAGPEALATPWCG